MLKAPPVGSEIKGAAAAGLESELRFEATARFSVYLEVATRWMLGNEAECSRRLAVVTGCSEVFCGLRADSLPRERLVLPGSTFWTAQLCGGTLLF